MTGILQISSTENTMILGVLVIAIAGLLYAGFWLRQILAEPKGSPKMQQVWSFIRTGANAYLSSQLRTIVVLIAVLVVVLFFSVAVVKPSTFAIEKFCPDIASAAVASVNVADVTSTYTTTHPGATTEEINAAVSSEQEAQIAKAD